MLYENRHKSREFATLSPVELNLKRADEIVEELCGQWQAAIDGNDGSAMHHEAEIAYLQSQSWRVSNLVSHYGVAEPIDPVFVYEIIDFIKASDIDRETYDGSVPHGAEQEIIGSAVDSLTRRNAGLAEAA